MFVWVEVFLLFYLEECNISCNYFYIYFICTLYTLYTIFLYIGMATMPGSEENKQKRPAGLDIGACPIAPGK